MVVCIAESSGISLNISLNWSTYTPSGRFPLYIVKILENKIMIPVRNMTSPTRVVRNAFFAAAAAEGFWNQNPISKYEHNPTSSQQINNCKILSERTTPSIAAVNNAVSAKYLGLAGSCDIYPTA